VTAAQRIVAGTQAMTVFKDTKKQAADAVRAAIGMVKGEDPGADRKVNNRRKDVPSILLKPVVVDKANLDEMLIESGYMTRADVYGK
jgi:D-xylose transport system substrate-binding protein